MNLFIEDQWKIKVSPEAKLVPEFKALITKDKTKDKRNAIADLAFVYFYTDYKSPYSKYTATERVAAVNKIVGYPPEQQPHTILMKAVAKYAELQETPSIRSLIAIRESLMASTRIIERLKTQIEDALDAPPPEDDEEDENSTPAANLAELVEQVEQLLKLGDRLPKTISSIEQLEEKVKKEQSNERKIKGGGSNAHFED